MTNNSSLATIYSLGQSIWLDFIQRNILLNGELSAQIEADKIAGLTSNPSIFKQAIAGSDDYDASIKLAVTANPEISDTELFNVLAIEDIQMAADIFKPIYDASRGDDGMVSLEVSPELADNSTETVAQAKELHARVNRANLLIKVPGTKAGVQAFEELTAAGISVNVTLLFSVERYKEIVQAYLNGLETRLEAGLDISRITSVASFFVSRVESAVDDALNQQGSDEAKALRGKIAIANAKAAYGHFQNIFNSPQFAKLTKAGALPQRLLWASTGTKNSAYSDVVYIEDLIGEQTVNTVPPATLDAFRDHGTAKATLADGIPEAHQQLEALKNLGIDLLQITEELEKDGVNSFCQAFDELMSSLKTKRETLLKSS